MQATVAARKPHGKVGSVGYCWGGSLAWLAATRLDGVSGSVGYYGGQIAGFKDEKLKCPVMLHFGESDKSIPMSDVDAVRKAHPEVEIHIYPAGHGFNCDQRADYSAEDAQVARERTLEFFRTLVGGGDPGFRGGVVVLVLPAAGARERGPQAGAEAE